MKRFLTILFVIGLLVGVQNISNAIQTGHIEKQKEINKSTANQAQTTNQALSNTFDKQILELSNRYTSNFRNCEKFQFSNSLNIFGLKTSFQFNIDGWQDNKCYYNITGNVNGIGKDIREVFKINDSITDENIAKIKPQIQCKFTQENLNTLVNWFTEKSVSNDKDSIASLMKKPFKDVQNKKNQITDEEIIQLISNPQVCTILNREELINEVTKILYPTELIKDETTNPKN